MLLPYYIILSVLEPSTTFSASHDLVTMTCDITLHPNPK